MQLQTTLTINTFSLELTMHHHPEIQR